MANHNPTPSPAGKPGDSWEGVQDMFTPTTSRICIECGTVLGLDCGDAEPDFSDEYCSEGCAQQTAGLGYDRDVLEAAQRIEAAALALAALIDGANPDVCKRAEALLLDKSTAPTEPRRHGPPAWRRLFFLDVAEATARRGGA